MDGLFICQIRFWRETKLSLRGIPFRDEGWICQTCQNNISWLYTSAFLDSHASIINNFQTAFPKRSML